MVLFINFNGTLPVHSEFNYSASLLGILSDARLPKAIVQHDITGNGITSTKLATARTICCVSFDGIANISLQNNADYKWSRVLLLMVVTSINFMADDSSQF